MVNCIFSGHCFEFENCDKSCPSLAQVTYLLERNNIGMSNQVFNSDPSDIIKFSEILKKAEGQFRSVIDSRTTFVADMLTYCGICENWRGSQLHCTVYNLKFSQYIDAIQKSWSGSPGSEQDVDYLKIWSSSAKILIISNIDYVNFKDFQCQTLLSLIQSRAGNNFTTIVVSPPVSNLVGDSPFFARLTEMLNKQKVV